MSRADFIEQLKNLGYRLDSVTPQGFVVFDYEIPIGSKRGEKIKLAFAVGEDFPLNPPGGPHVSPRLLPMHTSNDLPHPHGAVHPSDQLGLLGKTGAARSRDGTRPTGQSGLTWDTSGGCSRTYELQRCDGNWNERESGLSSAQGRRTRGRVLWSLHAKPGEPKIHWSCH